MSLKQKSLITACCLTGFLGFICCFFPFGMVSEPAQIQATQATITEFIVRAKEYHETKNGWPVGKTNMCIKLSQETIDAEFAAEFLDVLPNAFLNADSWGRPFLVIGYDNCFIVLSAGEDGIYHTSDDIIGRYSSSGRKEPLDANDVILNGPFRRKEVVEETRQQEIKRIRRTKTGGLE